MLTEKEGGRWSTGLKAKWGVDYEYIQNSGSPRPWSLKFQKPEIPPRGLLNFPVIPPSTAAETVSKSD